jgi:nucleoside-diphosphate-sugar epimerase
MRVLVTGPTGFVGRVLCAHLAAAGHDVRGAVRRAVADPDARVHYVIVGDIRGDTNWMEALAGVDCVIHLAARVHVLGDAETNSHLYFETNEHGSRSLARAAAAAGVRRLVYLSSVKVNGEVTAGRPFTPEDVPEPTDAYGRSKWLAECSIREVERQSGMESVIIRAPLVYGPGVRANFLRLMRWAESSWPVPLGAVRNQRSLVSVWNLCDLLTHVLACPAAAGRTWMVSDGDDVSTAELVRRIAGAMVRNVRIIPVPLVALRACASLVGRGAEVQRLCSSLTVDISRTRRDLNWSPPVGVDEALRRTVEWYLKEGRNSGA